MKWRDMLERIGQGPKLRDDSVPDDETTDKKLRSLIINEWLGGPEIAMLIGSVILTYFLVSRGVS